MSEQNTHRSIVRDQVGIDQAINAFISWKDESRPFHRGILSTANQAISEHGFSAYSDFLVDAFSEFKSGLLAKAKEYEPGSNDDANEVRLSEWVSERFPSDNVEGIVVAAVYERGIDAVQEAFETSPESGLSM